MLNVQLLSITYANKITIMSLFDFPWIFLLFLCFLKFWKESPLVTTRGKVLEYLGIMINYRKKEKKFSMKNYITKLLEEVPYDMSRMAKTPNSRMVPYSFRSPFLVTRTVSSLKCSNRWHFASSILPNIFGLQNTSTVDWQSGGAPCPSIPILPWTRTSLRIHYSYMRMWMCMS